jgi:hypothetical protein
MDWILHTVKSFGKICHKGKNWNALFCRYKKIESKKNQKINQQIIKNKMLNWVLNWCPNFFG